MNKLITQMHNINKTGVSCIGIHNWLTLIRPENYIKPLRTSPESIVRQSTVS